MVLVWKEVTATRNGVLVVARFPIYMVPCGLDKPLELTPEDVTMLQEMDKVFAGEPK